MGYGTYLKTSIYFSHKTYNTKRSVLADIEELKDNIEAFKRRIAHYALMTEPSKFIPKDSDPMYYIENEIDSLLSHLEDYYIALWKLELLYDNWDESHDENDLAFPTTNDERIESARVWGDYVVTSSDT